MKTIDVLGVIIDVLPCPEIHIRNQGTTKDRRYILIADETNLSIQVTLWGANARRNDFQEG